jgi:hypothetical protein
MIILGFAGVGFVALSLEIKVSVDGCVTIQV